jgi:hypothetical protein
MRSRKSSTFQKEGYRRLTVQGIGAEYHPPVIALEDHMVKRSGQFHSRLSRHRSDKTTPIKQNESLTPPPSNYYGERRPTSGPDRSTMLLGSTWYSPNVTHLLGCSRHDHVSGESQGLSRWLPSWAWTPTCRIGWAPARAFATGTRPLSR